LDGAVARYQARPVAALQGMEEAPKDEALAAAVALGWRVAELYSLVDDPGDRTQDTLLPAHSSLAPGDQLELQIRAAQGEAARAGVTSEEASLGPLVAVAHETAGDSGTHEAFREQLRARHVEISKELWARGEAFGKAYELGNGLSDTYGRVCRAFRESSCDRTTWEEVFDPGRIERLLQLLDDLQSRLDPKAVAVVRDQLDRWRMLVPERLKTKALPGLEDVRVGLRRQTVIWRQLIAGDKKPEAYLDADQRAQVRETMRKLVWRRYRGVLLLLIPVLTLAVFLLPQAVALYEQRSGLVSVAAAVVGGLGITRASVVLTLRTRLHDWADLLWHRALVQEIADATLTIDDVFWRSQPRQQRRIVSVTKDAAVRVRATVRARQAET
jgi:hypothetical protein